MSKKNDLPEEAGKVNWERLEQYSQKGGGQKKKKKKQSDDDSLIKAVAANLTEEERNSPYPDEFLADINIMRNDLDGGTIDLSTLEEDDGEAPDALDEASGEVDEEASDEDLEEDEDK